MTTQTKTALKAETLPETVPGLMKQIVDAAVALNTPILTQVDLARVSEVCGIPDRREDVVDVIARLSDFILWRDGGPVLEGEAANLVFCGLFDGSNDTDLIDLARQRDGAICEGWQWGWRLRQERIAEMESMEPGQRFK